MVIGFVVEVQLSVVIRCWFSTKSLEDEHPLRFYRYLSGASEGRAPREYEARTKSAEKKKSSILTGPLVIHWLYQFLEQARAQGCA